MKRKLFFSLLALLGLSSCMQTDLSDLFGSSDSGTSSTYVDYRFVGTVTNADDDPLENILVTINDEAEGRTEADGTYAVEFSEYSNVTITVTFSDTDQAINGGEFKSQTRGIMSDDVAEYVSGRIQYDFGQTYMTLAE
ncbi:MAG: radical SAM-associated putative lipoprotein [Rikenellaceae bacterium]